jgi:hypothetical protein
MDAGDVARVVILGTDHLHEWDGVDGRPDILSSTRQAELDELTARLARFAPNKVAVEVFPPRQKKVDGLFDSFRVASGGPEDATPAERREWRSEVVQIGLRLAAASGATVHAIDADWTLAHEPVEDYFERHPAERVELALSPEGEAVVATWSRLRDTLPLAQFLAHLNRPPDRTLNDREYLDRCLTIGAGDNWGGVDLVASWYRRNLRIFANLLLIAEPGDRIVVVYGLGHIPSLTHFAETSGRVECVDPVPLLTGPADGF